MLPKRNHNSSSFALEAAHNACQESCLLQPSRAQVPSAVQSRTVNGSTRELRVWLSAIELRSVDAVLLRKNTTVTALILANKLLVIQSIGFLPLIIIIIVFFLFISTQKVF